MAVGKYYSQTKLSVLLRRRADPQVEFLDSEYQALVSLIRNRLLESWEDSVWWWRGERYTEGDEC